MRRRDPFRCEVSYTAGSWHVALFGELDIATAPEVEGAVQVVGAVSGSVVLDLRGLQFMDARGVHLILQFDAAVRRGGFDFCVVTDGGIVRRLLVISGVDTRVDVIDRPLVLHPERRIEYAVIATDAEGRVTIWNEQAERLYGWSALEVLGRPIMELTVGPQDRQVAEEILDCVQRDGQWEGEFVVRGKDGSRFQAHVRDALIKDADGNFAGFAGVSVDSSVSSYSR